MRSQNIYIKTGAKLHLQNLADKLINELKQIKIKEAQGVKIRVKITWVIEGKICTN